MKGNELNARQAQVYALRQQGKRWTDIGRELGIHPGNVQQAYNRAVVKVARRERQEARNA